MARSTRIEPPIVIGNGCDIGEDIVIEGPAVIGHGCVLGDGAHVARGLLLAHTHLLPRPHAPTSGYHGDRRGGGAKTGLGTSGSCLDTTWLTATCLCAPFDWAHRRGCSRQGRQLRYDRTRDL